MIHHGRFSAYALKTGNMATVLETAIFNIVQAFCRDPMLSLTQLPLVNKKYDRIGL